MTSVEENPNVVKQACNPELQELLKALFESLEVCQKSLASYLEQKRVCVVVAEFVLFFFLALMLIRRLFYFVRKHSLMETVNPSVDEMIVGLVCLFVFFAYFVSALFGLVTCLKMVFPRFYFVSDAQLLEILGQGLLICN